MQKPLKMPGQGNNKKEPDHSSSDSQNTEKTLQPFHTLLIAVVIIVAAILIGQAIKNSQKAPESPDGAPVAEMEEGAETADEIADIGETGGLLHEDAMRASEFDGLQVAQQTINSTQGKVQSDPDYETVRGPILLDPDEEHIVYFATADSQTKNNFVGVYRYNTENRNWRRLYKQTYEPIDEERDVGKTLQVVAIQNGALILVETPVDTSFGTCDSRWLAEGEEHQRLVKIDLETAMNALQNPQAFKGLEAYDAPQETIEREEQRIAECKE